VDIESQSEQNLAYVFTLGMPNANVLRIDPHPAWSRDYTKVCFNAAPEGRRQIYVADLSELT
jgi:Tol biopolymer transport system component